MKPVASYENHQTFEDIKQEDTNGTEFWYARALAKVLEYSDFRNFINVIDKAKEACVNSGFEVTDHIVECQTTR
jgi:DNA-damage-inducible protein D